MPDLAQRLEAKGHAVEPLFTKRYPSNSHAIDAARARAYRAAKKLGVRIETATGWHDLHIRVIR